MKPFSALLTTLVLAGALQAVAAAQTVSPAPDNRPAGSVGTPINITLPDDWAPASIPVDNSSDTIKGVPVSPSSGTVQGTHSGN